MVEKSMFYGARPSTFEKAKMLRNNMTAEELLLWNVLKGNQILDLRFKAQHPVSIYIVDFYCHKLKLVIEIDGENHKEIHHAEYDKSRTSVLNSFGVEVIRFANKDVREDLSSVLNILTKRCKLRIDRLGLSK